MIESEREARQEEDYLAFQLQELEELSLVENEEEELEVILNSLEHADEIRGVTGQSWEQIKNAGLANF